MNSSGNGRNRPNNPVHIFPLSSVIAARIKVTPTLTVRVMTASQVFACWSVGLGMTDGTIPSSSSTVTPSGHEHRVHGQPPVAGPVHVAQVQDERELVEDQGGPEPEERGRAGPPVHRIARG